MSSPFPFRTGYVLDYVCHSGSLPNGGLFFSGILYGVSLLPVGAVHRALQLRRLAVYSIRNLGARLVSITQATKFLGM